MSHLSLVQSIAKTITTGIEAECNILRDEANNRIGAREVARSFVNKNIADMPEIVTGTHLVSYIDDRGGECTKEQAKNLSFWNIALQTTIETGHTTYELLGSIFQQWAKDTLNVTWAIDQATNVATLYVEAMRELGILNEKKETIEFINSETKQPMKASVNKLSPEFKELMGEYAEELRRHTHMVCKPLTNVPNDWVNTEVGVAVNAGLKLIKGQAYKGNKVDPRVLAAVNKLQKVAFVVSPYMIDVAYDVLDNQVVYAPKTTTGRAVRQFESDLRMYREIIQYGKGIYHFPVTMDTRGRMYYRGGLLTPQGTDFCKAAFQFAEYKELGETGADALLIHTANMLGMDKLSITMRLNEVHLHWLTLMSIEDHHELIKAFPKATVYQAFVAVKELQRLAKAGFGKDVTSNLVCHQDGTCNGLQHMAAITRNKQTAIAVNCVASTVEDQPADIYGIIADAAAKLTTGAVKAIIEKYGRDMAKDPVMTTGYGAGLETVMNNTGKYLAERGENSSLARAVGAAYVLALNTEAGAVRTLTAAFKGRAELAIKQGVTRIKWKTADGFLACTEYRDIEEKRVRAGVFNSLMATDTQAPLDLVKTKGAMCPNFVHSIDATHLRMVVNACEHDLVTVHDSIGSHAGTYFATAKTVREKFVEVHQYDALESICNSLDVRTPKFRGEYDAAEAINSTYIFS